MRTIPDRTRHNSYNTFNNTTTTAKKIKSRGTNLWQVSFNAEPTQTVDRMHRSAHICPSTSTVLASVS